MARQHLTLLGGPRSSPTVKKFLNVCENYEVIPKFLKFRVHNSVELRAPKHIAPKRRNHLTKERKKKKKSLKLMA